MTDLDLPTLARPEPWVALGACRGMDPDLFFPERGESLAPVKAICAQCPVAAECLDYALRTGQKHGVWGGTSERERRNIRAGRPRGGQQKPIQHGTNAGYSAHKRRGEEACDPCKDAHAAARLGHRDRRQVA